MLVPKRAKYRKQQKGVIRGKAYKGVKISFGEYGLLSEEKGLITSRQIEAARRAITHYTQRGGRLWIRIFPHKPITKSRLKPEWVEAKEMFLSSLRPLNKGECFLKW